MKAPDCGKICHTSTRAVALVLASAHYRRAYYCSACRAWHTTSRALSASTEPIHYRLSTPHYER
ncbi:hypothetical protein QMK33_19780 [Hymenobacter sp. H14-R3]|uniref:hypothetical protein n=1 Tax=Hymenobacter sp. H14-R3 TaxID=3046308 RepID=UPI0024BA8582|nr:hypothetical protein [Hymenobacter sp. H14-R3]MDJ0367395.1 hypothetical protein [Hymenobacter sp. H14-R3]